jgi:hypothetical protein
LESRIASEPLWSLCGRVSVPDRLASYVPLVLSLCSTTRVVALSGQVESPEAEDETKAVQAAIQVRRPAVPFPFEQDPFPFRALV